MGDGHFTPRLEGRAPVVWPSRIDPSGRSGPTWRVANGPNWQRTSTGLYLPARVPRDRPEQRIVEAAARLAPDGGQGALTGWAALRWYGAAYFDGAAGDGLSPRIELLSSLGGRLRSDRQVLVRRGWISRRDVEIVDGVPIVPVQRALFDEIHSRRTLWPAVTAIDMTAAAGLNSVALFTEYLSTCSARNGVILARRASELAKDDAWSPREVWTRLVWVLDADLPEPLLNQRVYDLGGALVGTPDLLDPESGVAVEYDGAAHRGADRHRRDVVRAERFRAVGLEQVVVVAGESRTAVADRMRAARGRALATPRPRGWTLERPSWDPAPPTLDERLARDGMAAWLARPC